MHIEFVDETHRERHVFKGDTISRFQFQFVFQRKFFRFWGRTTRNVTQKVLGFKSKEYGSAFLIFHYFTFLAIRNGKCLSRIPTKNATKNNCVSMQTFLLIFLWLFSEILSEGISTMMGWKTRWKVGKINFDESSRSVREWNSWRFHSCFEHNFRDSQWVKNEITLWKFSSFIYDRFSEVFVNVQECIGVDLFEG